MHDEGMLVVVFVVPAFVVMIVMGERLACATDDKSEGQGSKQDGFGGFFHGNGLVDLLVLFLVEKNFYFCLSRQGMCHGLFDFRDPFWFKEMEMPSQRSRRKTSCKVHSRAEAFLHRASAVRSRVIVMVDRRPQLQLV